MVVLINLNQYQGGGETLLVRFSKYLLENKVPFLVICSESSFIFKELKRINVDKENLLCLDIQTDFNYLSTKKRENFIEKIIQRIDCNMDRVSIVTFTLKDLYIAKELTIKIKFISISHLILHIQDYLYFSQSLLDKLFYKINGKRIFSRNKVIHYNVKLLRLINSANGLISMAQIINDNWRQEIKIDIPQENIIPLPTFVGEKEFLNSQKENKKKIVWIGRIVDFKIPALLNMLLFISHSEQYSLTIIGSGDIDRIKKFIRTNQIDESKITFLGQIDYSSLKNEINEHSIGYAMGTSLVELAELKMPVIIALASYDHNEFKQPICGGLFYNQPKGCDGSAAIGQSDYSNFPQISQVIQEIEQDYQKCAENCFEYAKSNYSIDNNFKAYLKIIQSTSLIDFEGLEKSPKPTFLRKKIYQIAKGLF